MLFCVSLHFLLKHTHTDNKITDQQWRQQQQQRTEKKKSLRLLPLFIVSNIKWVIFCRCWNVPTQNIYIHCYNAVPPTAQAQAHSFKSQMCAHKIRICLHDFFFLSSMIFVQGYLAVSARWLMQEREKPFKRKQKAKKKKQHEKKKIKTNIKQKQINAKNVCQS